MRVQADMEYRGVKHLISRRGEPITLVRLEDVDGEQVQLYTEHEPLGVTKGERVHVTIDLRDVRGSCDIS